MVAGYLFSPMKKLLFIGYGNVDRQDDGVAWHVLVNLAHKLGYYAPDDPEESFETRCDPELIYVLQLTPDMADILMNYERICFIDAHTGNIPDDLQISDVKAEFQNSPFTHHMTPQTLLAFVKALYGTEPLAELVSIRGFEFGFSRELSSRTQAIASQAAETIFDWLST